MSGSTEQIINSPGRLKKRPEFLCVAEKGQKWVSESVVVQVLPQEGECVKFGFTATKKIGNAVIRNRAKRRLRAVADSLCKSYQIKPSNIVFIARDTTPACDWDKLMKDAVWCLKRLEILKVT